MQHVWFWPDIHMTPEEGMRAHLDLQGGEAAAGVMLPIHWGTFNLAPHPWDEPAEGTVTAARRAGARVVAPRPGQPFEPGVGLPLELWWRAVAARPAGREAAVPTDGVVAGTGAADGAPASGAGSAGASEAESILRA